MPDINPEYEALGIHPDTMTCVAIVPKRQAQTGVWALATQGIECSVALDPDGKRWHVAVRGGLGYNPAAYFATIRGEERRRCASTAHGQHPQEVSK